MTARINRRIIPAAALTGLLTGLLVSSTEEFFSRDGTFSGTEALATFVSLPLVAAFLVSTGLRQRRLIPRLTGVAYLTLAIPLFGIGMGGANVLQQALGGVVGGGFWGLLFAIDLSHKGDVSK
ncbi:MAG: hypothetical protein QF844_01985 [Acidimicrobiales bacterium]|nr:hypothetical protein [Acidimicrobiales bacterium]